MPVLSGVSFVCCFVSAIKMFLMYFCTSFDACQPTLSQLCASCGEIARNVTLNIVSGLVVKTLAKCLPSCCPLTSNGNFIVMPSLLPIQFFCMTLTRSGQCSSLSKSFKSSSAYCVTLKNHWLRFLSETLLLQRQHLPSSTCSFANTVWQLGHKLTG